MSPRRESPYRFEYLLLGLVYLQPRWGYDLYQELSQPQGLGLIWKVKQPQVYAILEKLEAAGYLTSKIVPIESYPDRREYHLTESGRQLFVEWVTAPADHPYAIRQDFMARLYFARCMDSEIVKQLIRGQMKITKNWISENKNRKARLAEGRFFEIAVYDYRIQHSESILSWLHSLENIK